eukprot:TRINITY_DN3975_c0_g1_i11.p1 TRINITY_DN3975_c0_g1~~TRINITY_DN3975_c0_g1_i11.p1  ORF type:complete len:253 (-),score=78.63 TRINITY_DN3975_c0_g1_i11:48-806(-)
MNDEGVMTGSVLVVQIMEARDLARAGSLCVELAFDDQRQITQVKTHSAAVWNEKFSFDVTNKEQKIVINLCEAAGKRVIGSCTYALRDLNPPEYTVDSWVPLRATPGGVVGQLKLSLQWIVSRVEFFNNLISKTERQINESEDELNFYETKLRTLQGTLSTGLEPFGFMHADTLQNQRSSPRKEKFEYRMKQPTRPAPQTELQLPAQFSVLENRAREKIDQVVPQVMTTLGLSHFPIPVSYTHLTLPTNREV